MKKLALTLALILACVTTIMLPSGMNDSLAATTPEPEYIVATNDFCPFMCLHGENEGFSVDLAKRVFKDAGIEFEFEEHPWARGVRETTVGNIYGLLAAGKSEAPALMFPEEPVGVQYNCFFTPQDSTWQYTSKEDLKDDRIIVFINWGHRQDLREYLGEEKYDEMFIELSHDGDYDRIAADMIKQGRADAVWSDPRVNAYESHKEGSPIEGFKNSGCISVFFLYLGFTPKTPERSQELITIFNEGVRELRQSGELAKILQKYNVEDWIDEEEIPFH